MVLRGQDNNILTHVGFVVLIALAARNAILIVEFAKQLKDRGMDRFAAAVGASAELRQTPGTAVFSGMIGGHRLRPLLHARVLCGMPMAGDAVRSAASGARGAGIADGVGGSFTRVRQSW